MSNSKMLIDASHPEETRVVVLKGNRIEDFDFESASKKQLRGNIYLAKVTRVEPSLQAAFIEYGGNRHGFLAFSEIHPDYYQIPFADRQALLEEEARANRDEDDEARTEAREGRGGGRRGGEGRNGGGSREAGRTAQNGEKGAQNGERSAQGRGDRERGERDRGDRSRGDRDRNDRERGQRRSRRHRRSQTSALDQRGPADDSLSEAVSPEALMDDEAIAALDGAAVDAPAVGRSMADDATSEVGDVGMEDDLPALEAGADEGGAALQPVGRPTETPDAATLDAEPAAAEPADFAPADREGDGAEGAAEPVPVTVELDAAEPGDVADDSDVDATTAEPAGVALDPEEVEADDAEAAEAAPGEPALDGAADPQDEDAVREEEQVEQIGGDALSDVAPRPTRLRRHYKIQEVIKRRQILLIQVVKEERGNKGAALTTYLSLAGRYSVLMPNTAKGGGISRKITDGEDRKRLKAIAGELEVPEGMGVILRTAGASRSPIEVRRDFEYLLRMWESVRELTLKSAAPALVYEEGSLIKRSIRDLYSKDIEEVVVSGEAGFAEARDFMRMLMPGNVKDVIQYRDPQPVFVKSGVEAQLDAMFSPQVTLKSGGYLVINQTEALVAIDVNSGRSTREHNIEDTALRTNMEAADEVARQLRLRDLAGLIVVDFIDMEEGRNNRSVERRLKDALKNDRARIQIGHISHFGLLEMSRQRIRTGVLEGSTVVCPHCAGAGTVRSTASIALYVLRLVEDALLKDASHDLLVSSRAEVALYMLNQKRAKLVELEQRFGVTLTVSTDPALTGMTYHAIERGEPATPAVAPARDLVRVDSFAPIFEPGSEVEDEATPAEDVDVAPEVEDAAGAGAGAAPAEAGDGEGRRRKRRRRRRGRDGAEGAQAREVEDDEAAPADGAAFDDPTVDEATPEAAEASFEAPSTAPAAEDMEAPGTAPAAEAPTDRPSADAPRMRAPLDAPVPQDVEAAPPVPEEAEPTAEPAAEAAPKRRRSRRTPVRAEAEPAEAAPTADEVPAQPRRRRPSRARAAEATPAEASGEPAVAAPEPAAVPPTATAPEPSAAGEPVAEASAAPAPAADEPVAAVTDEEPREPVPNRPKRSGWWQRAKTSFGS